MTGTKDKERYIDTLDGKFNDMKYISAESNFSGFIMDYSLTFQRYELPTNKYKDKY